MSEFTHWEKIHFSDIAWPPTVDQVRSVLPQGPACFNSTLVGAHPPTILRDQYRQFMAHVPEYIFEEAYARYTLEWDTWSAQWVIEHGLETA